MATLTYVYADSTAVVGPLAIAAEPHCYDLCERHAARLTAPRGWEVVRHEDDPVLARARRSDDLEALARPAAPRTRQADATGRRGHLRAVPSAR